VFLTSGAAEFRYVVLTEQNGKDISADTAKVALIPVGQRPNTDTDWLAPDSDAPQTVKSRRVLGLFIDNIATWPAGEYYLWGRISDNPEVVPRRAPTIVVVA